MPDRALQDLIGLILASLALTVCIAALLAVCYAAFPNVVTRARHNAQEMPWRSFFIGLINFLFFGVVATFLAQREALAITGIVLFTILFSFMTLGLAAVALLVGERLRPNDTSSARQVIWGAVTLVLGSLVPLLGWIVVPTLATLVGFGALIIALIPRRQKAEGGEQ